MFPLDDGAVNRITHMHVPWTAFRTSFRYCARRQGARGRGTEHRRRLPHGRDVRRTGSATASPAVLCEQGDWISGWAWYLADGEVALVHRGQGRRARGRRDRSRPRRAVLVADGALVDGGLEVALAADGVEIARRNLGVHPPLAWAPDGAFLTVGYGRPFPVSDDYAPPAPAPPSLVDVTIQVGPLPPFDLEAEMARIMRHQ